MKTLADALAKIDKVEREISGVRPKELRDAIRGYTNAQRELIKALGELIDRFRWRGSRNLSWCGSSCQPCALSMPKAYIH